MKWLNNYFTLFEKLLWLFSVAMILVFFFAFHGDDYLTLGASLLGVTSLIFYAKGNPFGPFLMIIFCLIYGYISYQFTYYGELVTYVGMTLPMTVFSLITWLKNPFDGNAAEVEVHHISRKEAVIVTIGAIVVTILFYFILGYFGNANLIPSTISVTTSFVAAALTFFRSPYYALGYASNDAVLIVLWALAAIQDISYVSVLVCFIIFFFNDSYGFINWKRMARKQAEIRG